MPKVAHFKVPEKLTFHHLIINHWNHDFLYCIFKGRLPLLPDGSGQALHGRAPGTPGTNHKGLEPRLVQLQVALHLAGK